VKCVFLAQDDKKLKEVYSGQILDRLVEETGIQPTAYVTQPDLEGKASDLRDVECIFSTWNMPVVSETFIHEILPNLQAVFYAAGSVKYFAQPFLNCDVQIFSAAAANAIPVAEFVTAQIILANKGYYGAQLRYKGRRFRSARRLAAQHPGNYGSKVGIIGVGAVGSKVIELLQPYSLRVLAYDPYLDDARAREMNCEKVSLEIIFQECQVISNHLPDIPDTQNMLNYSSFSKMQDAATFINTGRGAQVVEKDLVRVLRRNPRMCALLDVSRREPLWPTSSFYRMPNVFITPHIAGSIRDEQWRMAAHMLDAYKKWRAQDRCAYEVTQEILDRMA
jgi:phosphoglycerate dehydrogenase-like enzyme